MNYIIKQLNPEDYRFLPEFLYDSIYIPEGSLKPPKDIVEKPELKVYYRDFGAKDDLGLAAYDADGNAIGVVWTRIMDDYGHIDDETPSLAIAVKEPYRSRGVGTALMKAMISLLKHKGYSGVSLSAQKANRAVGLYQKLGFKTVIDKEEELIMLLKL